eukprot:CAMPEP_0172299210 /NCGR_PEP_ID=MMETSP1058-20130122/1569_1 /TAXON_ID=83371 /ORGANISM="Detonula confervacea, Strain CCMP 353" /LENGTH=424 /DNA_ID=CAMNT_0013008571 /DNA_START=81 /DNA_END=1355 /DNA_ORIENTATION=-
MKRRISPMWRISSAVLAVLAAVSTDAFTSTPLLEPRTATLGRHQRSPIIQPRQPSSSPPSRSSSTTSLNVLGQEGILGVGAPEIAVTLIVGYFVLGPSDLYKLVKEIGKFIQQIRTLGAETAQAFEGTMEDQLELTELRKAQAELSDAFNFRRSINTDGLDAFEKTSFSENTAVAEAATASGAVAAAVAGKEATATASDGSTMTVEEENMPKKKRRLVRRKKKKAVEEIDVPSEEDFPMDFAMEYPDLDMLDADFPVPESSGDVSSEISEEEKLRAERLERLTGSSSGDDDSSSEPDWFTASEEDIASEVLNQPKKDPALEAYEKQRFQSQTTPEEWNAQIMANEDALAPLSMVMKRLAILEDEKNAADKRLEEEYERRMDNEDKYYLEKRKVLEEAITDIQEEVYGKGDGEKEESGAATKFTV